jgi:YD repeat-containing protein
VLCATSTDSSGATTYTWNARDRLASISGPSVTASFQYDALGRRKSKTVNSVTTDFLYDGLNLVQGQKKVSGTIFLTAVGNGEGTLGCHGQLGCPRAMRLPV